MEKFIVSARKYRPQNFSTVVGQSHITTTLKNAIKNNQLAHAFLFCGPRGVGKTTCARILAKTINCENRTADGEACNECSSCTSFDNGTSLNIHELDAASNNSVEDIRVLVDQVRFAPQAGQYKVYIVDEVHMLTTQAFNAFLKTLEEPPPFAIFILATTEKHKIIPTILSRCQIFDFKRITNKDTVEHLHEICEKENIEADKTALHLIAQKSEGCLRDSLSILDKIVSFTNGKLSYANTLEHLNILDEDYYFRLLEAMQQQQLSDAILIYDEINSKGFEGDELLNGFAEFLRNVLVSSDARVVALLEVSDDFKQRYLDAATNIDTAWIVAALNVLNEAEIQYKQAKNKRLHVELALIKLSYLGQALLLVNEPGQPAKKKQLDTIKPLSFRALSPVAAEKKKIKPAKPVVERNPAAASTSAGSEAKLIIQNNTKREADTGGATVETAPRLKPAKTPRLKSLKEIQEEIDRKNRESEVRPLTKEALSEAWNQYMQVLEENKNYSGKDNFRQANLRIIDESSIEIIASNQLQYHFIEVERGALSTHFQTFFNNRNLVYKVILEENENELVVKEEYLNSSDQYKKIVSNYPLVEELKRRLKLQLDF